METLVQQLLTYKTVIVAGWLILFFVAERLRPAAETRRGWFGDWPRLLRNLMLWAVTAGVSLAVVVPASVWATELALWQRPGWWSGWHGLALDILLLEFWIYWWHRANHEVRFLWRFHEIHHLDRFLDTTSALRFHFGEVLLSAAVRAVVIMLLAMPIVSVLVFEIGIQLAALFHHSNLRLHHGLERALAWVVITPSLHWVHHHAVKADTDSNYGTILSVWDRLFGSRSRTGRTPELEIGVEGQPERPVLALLLRPFGSRS